MIIAEHDRSWSGYDPANRAQTDCAVQAIIPHRTVSTVKVTIEDLEVVFDPFLHLKIRTIAGYTATVNFDSGYLSVMKGENILESSHFNPEAIIALIHQRLQEGIAYLPCLPSSNARNTLNLRQLTSMLISMVMIH